MGNFLTDPKAQTIFDHFEQTRDLPRGLLRNIIKTESSGNPNAVSLAGAKGLMQFMPDRIKEYNVNMSDPADMVRAGADYLQDLIHQYKGNVKAAVAHYNGGAYNAQYQVDGSDPSKHVSKENQAINKQYVADVTKGLDLNNDRQSSVNQFIRQVNQAVAEMIKGGNNDGDIVSVLRSNPETEHLIQQAITAGDSNEQIVRKLGGALAKPYFDARGEVSKRSFTSNLANGAANGARELVDGAKGLYHSVTGNDAAAEQDYQRAQASSQNPITLAENMTTGGKLGAGAVKAVPAILPAVMTGGSSIPAMIAGGALGGAASAALDPLVEPGHKLENIATNAAIGGVTGGALGVVAKGAGAITNRIAGGTEEAQGLLAAKQAAAERLGVPLTVSDVNPLVRGIAGKEATNSAEQQLAQKVAAEKLGLSGYGGPIDSEMIAAARSHSNSLYDNALNGVRAVLTPEEAQGLQSNIKQFIQSAPADTRAGISANRFAQDLNDLASNTPSISAKAVQDLRSDIGSNMSNPELSSVVKQEYGNQYKKMTELITRGMSPEQLKAFEHANEQYSHLLAARKAVEGNVDRGTVSVDQLMRGGRSINKSDFSIGQAPFQTSGNDIRTLTSGDASLLAKALSKVIAPGSGGAEAAGAVLADAALGHVPTATILGTRLLAGPVARRLGSSSSPGLVNMLGGAGLGATKAAEVEYLIQALSKLKSPLNGAAANGMISSQHKPSKDGMQKLTDALIKAHNRP